MVVSAVEKFAQVIPLNLQEIFIWYFEQRGKYDLVSLHCAAPPVVKGVDNPERFLLQVNQEQQAESNQPNIDTMLPVIGMLAEQQGKTQREPDEMTKFLNNVEELGNDEKGEKNEV